MIIVAWCGQLANFGSSCLGQRIRDVILTRKVGCCYFTVVFCVNSWKQCTVLFISYLYISVRCVITGQGNGCRSTLGLNACSLNRNKKSSRLDLNCCEGRMHPQWTPRSLKFRTETVNHNFGRCKGRLWQSGHLLTLFNAFLLMHPSADFSLIPAILTDANFDIQFLSLFRRSSPWPMCIFSIKIC